VQNVKLSEDQCKAGDVFVKEFVKNLDKLLKYLNKNTRTNHSYTSSRRNIT